MFFFICILNFCIKPLHQSGINQQKCEKFGGKTVHALCSQLFWSPNKKSKCVNVNFDGSTTSAFVAVSCLSKQHACVEPGGKKDLLRCYPQNEPHFHNCGELAEIKCFVFSLCNLPTAPSFDTSTALQNSLDL